MRHTSRARSAIIGSRQNDRRAFQIGPRIRVGGSVGKLGQKAKLGVGKVLSNKYVDMGLSLIPGVGPGIAAAANAAGHVLDTSKGGIHSAGDVFNVAKDAALTYGGSKLLGGLKTGGLKSGVNLLKGGGSSGGDTASMLDQLGADGGSRFRSIGSVGGFLKDNAHTIADLGKAGEGIYDRYQQNQDRAMAQREYDAAKPLRDAAQANLLDTSVPDTSGIFADEMNPRGRYRRVSVGSRGAY